MSGSVSALSCSDGNSVTFEPLEVPLEVGGAALPVIDVEAEVFHFIDDTINIIVESDLMSKQDVNVLLWVFDDKDYLPDVDNETVVSERSLVVYNRPVTTEASRAEAMQQEYIRNSHKAYREGEYRLCLLMIAKITSTDASLADLSVNCAYDYWRSAVLATLKDPTTVTEVEPAPPLLMITDVPPEASVDLEGSAVLEEPSEVSAPAPPSDALVPVERGVQQREELPKARILEIVNEAFTHLLGQEGLEIQPYDYVRLSHIYLSEGALEGALQIMSLASARGFLECNLIIAQAWSIASRIQPREAERMMVYLTSAIMGEKVGRRKSKYAAMMEEEGEEGKGEVTASSSGKGGGGGGRREEVPCMLNSPLPLGYVYLHCAVHQKKAVAEVSRQKQLPAVKERRRQMFQHFLGLVSEAFFLLTGVSTEDAAVTGAWFSGADLWQDMGDTLVDTPFILLSEDSWWQAFLRAPLRDAPLRCIVSSMRKFQRGELVVDLLTRAMGVCKWNNFCRETLRAAEAAAVSDPSKRKWAPQFDAQAAQMTRITAQVRGFLARRRWPALRARVTEIREAFQASITVSDEAYARAVRRMLIGRIYWWRQYCYAWMWRKYNAATKIQSHVRMRQARNWYAWAKWRVCTANAMYVVAAQRAYDLSIARPFRHWFDLRVLRRKQASANLITKALQLSSYSTVLARAMEFLCTVLKVKRVHTWRRIFAWWRSEYLRKTRLHARTTLRFWARNLTRKRQERAKEARLAAKAKRMQEVKEQKEAAAWAAEQERLAKLAPADVKVEFVPLTPEEAERRRALPLQKEMWARWRAAYQRVLDERRKDWLSKQLAILFRRQQARRVVRAKRVRYEGQSAFQLHHRYKLVATLFMPWMRKTFVQRIQRWVRRILARRALRRLRNIKRYMKGMAQRRRIVTMKKIFKRIQKHNYLVGREKTRAAKWVVLLFRKIMHRAALRKKVRRKIALFGLLESFHLSYLHYNLRLLKNNTIYANKVARLTSYFAAVTRGALRTAFGLWLHQHRGEVLLLRLRAVFVTFRLERAFWVGAMSTVTIKPLDNEGEKAGSSSSSSIVFPAEPDTQPFAPVFKPWEIYHPSRPVLHRLTTLRLLKAWQSWMACFRIRMRYKRGSSRMLAQNIALSFVDQCMRRVVLSMGIQRFARRREALRQRKRRLLERRRESEMELIVTQRQHLGWFRCISAIVAARQRSRLRLQQWARHHLRRKDRNRYFASLRVSCHRIRSSRFQRVFMRKMLLRLQLAFCSHSLSDTTATATAAKGKRGPKDRRSATGRHQQLGSTVRKSSSAPRLSRTSVPVSDVYAVWSDDEKAHSDEDRPVVKNFVSTNRNHSKFSKAQQAAVALVDPSNLSFKSPEFNSHLFRLKQSGVFTYDSLADRLPPLLASQIQREAPRLYPDEVALLLSRADTVVCQHVCKRLVNNLALHSPAVNVVLSDGYLSRDSVDLLAVFAARVAAANPEGAEGQLTRAALRLNIAGVKMRLSTIVAFCAGLRTAPPVMHSLAPSAAEPTYLTSVVTEESSWVDETSTVDMSAFDASTVDSLAGLHIVSGRRAPLLLLSELVVDVESFGTLGLAVLMTAMEVQYFS